MSEYQRAKTETATQGSIPFVTNCDSCPRVNASYSSTTVGTSNADTLISTIGQLHDLQREVRELQAASKKTLSFYDSTSKLNKTVQIVIIILMVIPVIQLLLCAGVVYSLGIEDELPGLINWILGSVSILSILIRWKDGNLQKNISVVMCGINCSTHVRRQRKNRNSLPGM